MPLNVLMIAGEASGDVHGSGVVRELKKRLPSVQVYGVGGDNMRGEGMELVYHISQLSFMGFTEVVKNLSLIRKVERKLESLLDERRPDVVVLIDYPGFNLRFAQKAKRRGIKVLYYISPQVWAWNEGRVKKMKSRVDKMKVVFPFEVDIYRNEGIDVEFVGHPLAERIGAVTSRDGFFRANGFDASRKLLGLFPGSRQQEIEMILPTMLATAVKLHASLGVQIGIGVAPNLGVDFLKEHIPPGASIRLVENGTYDLMQHADAAVVTSGTATLETGWFSTPMVVVYRTSLLTFFIARLLVDVPYIGLVNFIAGRQVVPELIQHHMNAEKLYAATARLLTDETYARSMREELSVIKSKLGAAGASARVADSVINLGEAVS